MKKKTHTATAAELADILAKAREAAGLTQAELAARVGRTQPSISQIEKGKADPSLSVLIELARAVGLEVRLIPQRAVPVLNAMLSNGQDAANPKPLYTLR